MTCRRTIGIYAGIGAEESRMYAIGQVVQWTSGLPVGRRVWAAGRMLERPSGGGTAGVVRWLARTRQAVHPFTHSTPSTPSPPIAPLIADHYYTYMLVFTYTWIHTHVWRLIADLFFFSDLSSLAHSLILLYLDVSPRFPPLSRLRSRSERKRSLN